KWLAASEEFGTARLRVWSLTDGKERRVDEAPRGIGIDVRILADGKALALTNKACAGSREIHSACYLLWDGDTGKHLKTIGWPGDQDEMASLSDDGRLLAVYGRTGKPRVLDLATGRMVAEFDIPQNSGVHQLQLTP